MTSADAADSDPLAVFADVDDVAVRQIRQARQDFSPPVLKLLIEPDEVLVIALDKDGGPRRRTILGEPDGEVTGPVVLACSFVYPIGIGPNADGMTPTEILDALPDLVAEDIDEALHFAADAVRERQLPIVPAA